MFLAIVQTAGTLAALVAVILSVVELRNARGERREERAWKQVERQERRVESLMAMANDLTELRRIADTVGFQMTGLAFAKETLVAFSGRILASPDRRRLTVCSEMAQLESADEPGLLAIIGRAEDEVRALGDEALATLDALTGARTGAGIMESA